MKEASLEARAQAILGVGVPLHECGDNNWALSPDQALAALRGLLAADIGVLGGDVYVATEAGLESGYANWVYDGSAIPEGSDVIAESIRQAEEYITRCSAAHHDVLFTIVVDSKRQWLRPLDKCEQSQGRGSEPKAPRRT